MTRLEDELTLWSSLTENNGSRSSPLTYSLTIGNILHSHRVLEELILCVSAEKK